MCFNCNINIQTAMLNFYTLFYEYLFIIKAELKYKSIS